ncbi:hypothetical protein RvY_00091 [Ramazzottius varieornatus]|uniref:Uncharacterized protein n=1 Tax=Ramazzottius varieornatus TaxID=947166 RepID=A0A1D1UM42_RAMVA|nr:hypothetical protein RvY_00091 [Ramazzottius varieornatus]
MSDLGPERFTRRLETFRTVTQQFIDDLENPTDDEEESAEGAENPEEPNDAPEGQPLGSSGPSCLTGRLAQRKTGYGRKTLWLLCGETKLSRTSF